MLIIYGRVNKLDNIIVFILVDFLHNLLTAFWIGGQIVLLLIIIPSVKSTIEDKTLSKKLMLTIRKRISIGVYVCILGFAITGLMMTHRSPSTTHIFSFENFYSILLSFKHFLFIGMIVISLFRSRFLDVLKIKDVKKKEKINILLLIINIVLGISVLFLSSYLGVLSSLPG